MFLLKKNYELTRKPSFLQGSSLYIGPHGDGPKGLKNTTPSATSSQEDRWALGVLIYKVSLNLFSPTK